jgi:hypothetical protein
MPLLLESGYTSINKHLEELCGDKVECQINGKYTTMVLADGLGSGVKANILATLTSKILCTMISNNIAIEECIETILQSLPVCKVRGIAYSTFSIIHIDDEGRGILFEFDNPQAIYIHNGSCQDFQREELNIINKKVYRSILNLEENDVVIIMSDGAIHAGIGKVLNFGWQRNDVKKYLNGVINPKMSARNIASVLARACNDLYLGKPGDDTTVAAVKMRKESKVRIMVGPPVSKEQDNFYITNFLDGQGKKVVCGGTSSLIVARYLNEKIITTFESPDKEVPPIGFIEGIDLTTEGVLTLRKLLQLSQDYLSPSDLQSKSFLKEDGASLLAQLLFEEATDITFFVGQSINPAHQGLPIDITMKLKLVEKLSMNLKIMGKKVIINYD